MSFLRSFVNSRKKSDQEENNKPENTKTQNEVTSEIVLFGADMGTCGYNGFFPSNVQQPEQPKSVEPSQRKSGVTQEEVEELIRPNSLNPFI